MKRGLYCVLAICLLSFLAACSGGKLETSVEKRTKGMDYMEINKDVYPHDRMGPVRFTHDKHAEDYGIACEECHHIYADGKNVWTPDDSVDSCESCHDPAEPTDNIPMLEVAFHQNCTGCHKQVKEGEGPNASAPVMCSGCHVIEK